MPEGCIHNAHYVVLSPEIDRQDVLDRFRAASVSSVFHYVPLHSSPAGLRHGRVHGSLEVTEAESERLVRLPLWVELTEVQQDNVIEVLRDAVGSSCRKN